MNDNYLRREWHAFIIAIAAGLFYLPFMPLQFMGDDWLWIYNAKLAWSNPLIFFQRPMYGYFRPLNMIIISVFQELVGSRAAIFGLGNLLLHSATVFMLYQAAKKLEIETKVAITGTILFAFHFICAPVVGWIATGHDIWVTLISLLIIYLTPDFIKAPTFLRFIIIWLLGFAALLIKESGIVTLGLFFMMFYVSRTSPLKAKYRYYAIFWILSFMLFLAVYMKTRTFIDRQVGLGPDVFINLWYFMGYLLLPLSSRIVTMMPSTVLPILKAIRLIIMLLIPLASLFILWRAPRGVRLFLFWIVMFLSTIAIMDWGIKLFDLYPENTAARFMYTPAAGMAIVVAWFLSKSILLWGKKIHFKRSSVAVLLILFVAANFFAVKKTVGIYRDRQSEIKNVVVGLEKIAGKLSKGDTLTIVLQNTGDGWESIVQSSKHIHAICYILFDKEINVNLITPSNTEIDKYSSSPNMLIWDNNLRRFKSI